MLLQEKHSLLFKASIAPVALVILGAFAFSVAAILENVRFANATGQILGFVGKVRSFANEQKTFSPAVGEDVWDAMVRVQQISSATPRTNPWDGTIRAAVTANAEMGVESDLPARDCRRMALYFLGLSPAELGLLSIAAHPDSSAAWSVIYPPQNNNQIVAVNAACGLSGTSRLALVFKIK